MADLAGMSVVAVQGLPGGHQTRTDALAAHQEDRVAATPQGASTVLGEQSQVGIVAQPHRHRVRDALGEHPAEVDIAPAEVRRVSDDAGAAVDRAGDADAHATRSRVRAPFPPHALQRTGDPVDDMLGVTLRWRSSANADPTSHPRWRSDQRHAQPDDRVRSVRTPIVNF